MELEHDFGTRVVRVLTDDTFDREPETSRLVFVAKGLRGSFYLCIVLLYLVMDQEAEQADQDAQYRDTIDIQIGSIGE
jgi:hypothetical protein